MNPETVAKVLANIGLYTQSIGTQVHSNYATQYNIQAIEQINELNQLETYNMNEKLNSIASFSSAIRNKAYIVGSVNANGTMSFSDNPTKHDYTSQARAECTRLAKLYPGKLYIFVQLAGAEMLPQPVATISI